MLCQTLTKVFETRLTKLIDKSDRESFFRMSYLIHDLKYMCKPLVAPIVVSQTDLLQQLLAVVKQLHFVDACSQPKKMQEFENGTKFELIQAELDMCTKIERYL